MSKATFALVLWLFPPRLPLYCQENLGTKSPRVHDKASDISPKNMAVLWKVATKWAKALPVTAVQVELRACTVPPKSTGRGRTAQAWAHLRAITSDTVCTQWCPQHSMRRGTVEHCQTSMYTLPSNSKNCWANCEHFFLASYYLIWTISNDGVICLSWNLVIPRFCTSTVMEAIQKYYLQRTLTTLTTSMHSPHRNGRNAVSISQKMLMCGCLWFLESHGKKYL